MAGVAVQMSFILGLGLAVVVGLGLHFGDIIFSKDLNVLHFIAIGIPVMPIYRFISKILLFCFLFCQLGLIFCSIHPSVRCWYTTYQLDSFCI